MEYKQSGRWRRGVLTVGFFALIALGACGERPAPSQAASVDQPLRVSGSTTLSAAFNAIGQAYMQRTPGMSVHVDAPGSGAGIDALVHGQADVAMVSRDVRGKELEKAYAAGVNLRSYLVGYGAVVIMVHPSKRAYLPQITQAQVKAIFFDGSLTDWSQLHPELEGAIVVYHRDPQRSGTGEYFAKAICGDTAVPYVAHGIVAQANHTILEAIATQPNAMGYGSFENGQAQVWGLAYAEAGDDAAHCSPETIHTGCYALSRKMYLVTSSPISSQLGRFLEFTLSDSGQALLSENGVISLR